MMFIRRIAVECGTSRGRAYSGNYESEVQEVMRRAGNFMVMLPRWFQQVHG